MGTIIFLILRLVLGYNTQGDAQTLATVVSLDSIAFVLLLRFMSRRKG